MADNTKKLKTFGEVMCGIKRVGGETLFKPYSVLIFGRSKSGKTTTLYQDILLHRDKFNNVFHVGPDFDCEAQWLWETALNKHGGYYEHVDDENTIDLEHLVPNSHYIIDDQHDGSAKQNKSYKVAAKIIKQGRKDNIGVSISAHSDKNIPDIWWKCEKIYFKYDPTFEEVLKKTKNESSFNYDSDKWQVLEKGKPWRIADEGNFHHIGQVIQNIKTKLIPNKTYSGNAVVQHVVASEEQKNYKKEMQEASKNAGNDLVKSEIVVVPPQQLKTNLLQKLKFYEEGNKMLKPEITQILDALLDVKEITKGDYEKIINLL